MTEGTKNQVNGPFDEVFRARAGQVGTSVSHLVSNVVANALSLVGEVVADSVKVAESAMGELEGGDAGEAQSAGGDTAQGADIDHDDEV